MTIESAWLGHQTPADSVTMRETIHHGDFYHRRDVTLYASCGDEILAYMGRTSRYRFVFTGDNEFHRQAATDLDRDGKAELGWATFEVVGRP
jgi:hypothetical protein